MHRRGGRWGSRFAPRFHPPMRFAAPVRKELGIPTVFNYPRPPGQPRSGPLPGDRGEQPGRWPKRCLGCWPQTEPGRAMVVYGDDGLDELSTTGPSTVHELQGVGRRLRQTSRRTGWIRPTWAWHPPPSTISVAGTRCSTPKPSVRVVGGEPSPHRDIAVLNAAAACWSSDALADLPAGLGSTGLRRDRRRPGGHGARIARPGVRPRPRRT